jgi:hypothetical protein
MGKSLESECKAWLLGTPPHVPKDPSKVLKVELGSVITGVLTIPDLLRFEV